MTFRIKMLVSNLSGSGNREIETKFAGCKDLEDAKKKARSLYPVVVFKKVELISTE